MSGIMPPASNTYQQPNLPMQYYDDASEETDEQRGQRMRENIQGMSNEELCVKIRDMQNVLDTLEQEGLTRHGWDAVDLMRSLCENIAGQRMED